MGKTKLADKFSIVNGKVSRYIFGEGKRKGKR